MIPVTLANGTTVVLPYGEGTIPRAEVESFLARAGAMPASEAPQRATARPVWSPESGLDVGALGNWWDDYHGGYRRANEAATRERTADQPLPGRAAMAARNADILPALRGVFEGLTSSRNDNQPAPAQPLATGTAPGTHDPAETIDIAGMLGTARPGDTRPAASASAAPARSSEAASGSIDPRLMGGTGVFPEVERAMREGEPGGSNIYDPNFDPVAFYMNILGNEGSAQTDGEDEDFFLGQSRDELRRNLLNMGLGMMQAGGQPGAGFFDSLAYGGQTALAAEDRRRQREASAQTAADQRRRDIAGELLSAVNQARDYRAGREDASADREDTRLAREIDLEQLRETIRSNNMANDLGYFRANNAALNDSLERQLDMELFGIEPSATDTAMATHFMQNPETPQAQSWARRRASEIVRLARSGGIPSDMARSELDTLARTFGRGIIEDLASGGG